MTFVSRITMAAALALAVPAGLSTPAVAQALSPDVGNPLKEASSLAKQGNLSAAMARVKTARASANTSIERRKVAEMAAYVYTRGSQWSAAARELESIGAPASQLAPLYYRANDFGKAAALGRKAGGVQGNVIVAQAYFHQGNFKGAADIYQSLIGHYGARENWLQNLANAQYKVGDKKAYLATTTRLIKVDPSPARWRALLVDLKNESMPPAAKLALYELMDQTNNITKADGYQEFAKLAIIAGQPGVAKRALEEGQKTGLVSGKDAMMTRLLQAATARSNAAKAEFAHLPKTAEGYMMGGKALMGVGNYGKAAAYFAQALRVGEPDKDQALVMLGVSQLRAGDKAAAVKSFNAVSEDGPFGAVSSLWSLYASTGTA